MKPCRSNQENGVMAMAWCHLQGWLTRAPLNCCWDKDLFQVLKDCRAHKCVHSHTYQCNSDSAYSRSLKGIHLPFLWGNSIKLCQYQNNNGLEISWEPSVVWCDLCCSCCSPYYFLNSVRERPSLAQEEKSVSLKTKSQVWYKRPCKYTMPWESKLNKIWAVPGFKLAIIGSFSSLGIQILSVQFSTPHP